MRTYNASSTEVRFAGDVEKHQPQSRWIVRLGRTIHITGNLLSVFMLGLSLGLLMLLQHPVDAQQDPLTCASTLISPQVPEGSYIGATTIVSAADGQIVYLISDYDANTSTLLHVGPDDTITEIGQMPDMLGIYGYPRWDVDIEGGNAVFTSYGNEARPILTTIMFMDLESGEVTSLMGGVNEYEFGRVDGRIWWSSRVVSDTSSDFGFYLYDPVTATTIPMTVPKPAAATFAFSGRLVRMLPDGNVLFTVTRTLEDSGLWQTSYYRGDPQTGSSQLLHEEANDTDQFSYSNATTVLEDRIAYISDEGEYSEIDFDGNILLIIPLLGPGIYRDLHATPKGLLFTYANPEGSEGQDLYHISRSGVLSDLIPGSDNFRSRPPSIEMITAPNGEVRVWFNTTDTTSQRSGTLYVYDLPTDETADMNEPALVVENTTDFYSDPDGAYIVARVEQEAVLIDTITFEQTATGTDYNTKSVYFNGDQPHVLAQGRPRFVDNERGIVYFSPIFPPEKYDALYALTDNNADPVQVTSPEVNVPFSLHWNSFNLAPNGDVVYVGEDLKSLYRARCQPNT